MKKKIVNVIKTTNLTIRFDKFVIEVATRLDLIIKCCNTSDFFKFNILKFDENIKLFNNLFIIFFSNKIFCFDK